MVICNIKWLLIQFSLMDVALVCVTSEKAVKPTCNPEEEACCHVHIKGRSCDFFTLTLEQIIVLNTHFTYNKPILKISHVSTLQKQ